MQFASAGEELPGTAASAACTATEAQSAASKQIIATASASSAATTPARTMTAVEFWCRHCLKTFRRNKDLRKHAKLYHKDMELPPPLRAGRKARCAVPTHSPQELSATAALGEASDHRSSRCPRGTSSVHEFDNMPEFLKWKHDEENRTGSQFVKRRQDAQRRDGAVARTYYCHRSGRYKPSGRQLRHLKVQGSCKIGAMCSAAMYVRIKANGMVRVSYYCQHRGHSQDVAHQRLTSEQRSHIAGMLSLGIPFDDVLDRIQLSGNNSTVSRLHFTSKQDLKNIVRDCHLSTAVNRCASDADSVAAWIEENRQDGDRCLVRYVKFQGDEDSQRGLRSDDFMLILMSEAQIAGLRQLYQPLKEVAMDSTHGTNAYDFQLTTVMVLDEHGEGFPAAFCLSNRVDEVSMTAYLSVLKETVGQPLTDAVLMTDDTDVYSNAWTHVMGQPAHRLLCVWHVDRAWRKNLAKIHGDKTLKATVYKTIRSLMEITDVDTFQTKIAEFLEAAESDTNTVDFARYFAKEYASRTQLWAYCHRVSLKVHHNMHLEALHRVLKHIHMNGRKVRRMDNCIHSLLRLLRSKMHDRLLKVHKGKWTRHVMGIRKRHKTGVGCDPGLVSVVQQDKVFVVKGQKKDLDSVYMVEQNETVPHTTLTCPLRCAACDICVHTFSCTCVDAGLRNTICKHVHLVVAAVKPTIFCRPEQASDIIAGATASSVPAGNDEHAEDSICPDTLATEVDIDSSCSRAMTESETDAILGTFTAQRPHGTLQQYMEQIQQQYSCIVSEIGDSVELAAAACEQVKRTRSLLFALKAKQQLPDTPVPMEPANKRITPQRQFRSTKRKAAKRKAEETLSKPDNSEKVFLLASLGGEVELVSSSRIDTDHDYSSRADDVVAFEHSYQTVDRR